MNYIQLVADCHMAFGHPIANTSQPIDTDLGTLRVNLITEEFTELKTAIAIDDRIGIVDALQDLKYVLAGASLALGTDIGISIPAEAHYDELSDYVADLELEIQTIVTAQRIGDFDDFEINVEAAFFSVLFIEAAFGFDGPAHFTAVHLANMRKLVDGKPIFRADGKFLKPEGWVGPDEDHRRLLALAA